jgi:hypothetical protein
MPKCLELTGQVFGRLTVIERAEDYIATSGAHHSCWVCRCECGNETTSHGNNLKRGDTKSCGCLSKEIIDLTGQTFGRLEVSSRADDYISPSGNTCTQWNCVCECGTETIVHSSSLKRGTTRSCGCITKLIELTGQTFGRLTVIKRVENSNAGQPRWMCSCECGTETIVFGQNLRNGTTKSCGCLISETATLLLLGKPNLSRRKRPYEHIYNNMCSSAKRRNIPVTLTYEEYLTFINRTKCHYCHKPLTWVKHANKKGSPQGYNIDRKDSSNGYLLSNCIECCGWCNNHKLGDISYDTWYAMTEKFRTGELKNNGISTPKAA